MKKIYTIGIVCLILISCALVATMVSADTSGVLNPLTSTSGSSGVLNPLTSSADSSGVLNPLTSTSGSSGVLNPLTSTADSNGVLNPLTSSSNSSGVLNPISGNSSSTQDQSSNISGQISGINNSHGGIITENRLHLAKGEYSQHLIRFDNYGQIKVQAQEGSTFDLYSKKGESWPNSSTFKTDYDQTVKVSTENPAVMDVEPGIWVFTIDSPDQGGAYSLTASENGDENKETVAQSSDVPLRPITSEPIPTTNTPS